MHLRIPSDDDGVDLVVHFPRTDAIQELSLLSESIATLPDIMFDESIPVLANHAALGAFLIDVRAMVAFLSGPPANTRNDDQFARNFADGWTPSDEAEVHDATDGSVKEIHKQLAHITTIRIGDGGDTFPEDLNLPEEQIRDVARQMTDFYNRFATVSSMLPVGALRPWHAEDEHLITMAEIKARAHAPDARKCGTFGRPASESKAL
ncbi:hypothetical protein GCM10009776_37440 [Microbacterium deminutum]|uniref:Uncharacterized protein n=1 Tax=Microbacterium deminutum TaxID=344164 RepID=A0ABN2RLR8_9MICO